jgi:hypothetical protein
LEFFLEFPQQKRFGGVFLFPTAQRGFGLTFHLGDGSTSRIATHIAG